jgi:hypothetical protein
VGSNPLLPPILLKSLKNLRVLETAHNRMYNAREAGMIGLLAWMTWWPIASPRSGRASARNEKARRSGPLLVFRCGRLSGHARQGEFGNVGAQRSLDGLANQFLQLPIRELVRLSFKAQHSTTGRRRRTCGIERHTGPKPCIPSAVFERRTTNVNQFTACGLGAMIIVIYICAR